jgi:hypothetical protein
MLFVKHHFRVAPSLPISTDIRWSKDWHGLIMSPACVLKSNALSDLWFGQFCVPRAEPLSHKLIDRTGAYPSTLPPPIDLNKKITALRLGILTTDDWPKAAPPDWLCSNVADTLAKLSPAKTVESLAEHEGAQAGVLTSFVYSQQSVEKLQLLPLWVGVRHLRNARFAAASATLSRENVVWSCVSLEAPFDDQPADDFEQLLFVKHAVAACTSLTADELALPLRLMAHSVLQQRDCVLFRLLVYLHRRPVRNALRGRMTAFQTQLSRNVGQQLFGLSSAVTR